MHIEENLVHTKRLKKQYHQYYNPQNEPIFLSIKVKRKSLFVHYLYYHTMQMAVEMAPNFNHQGMCEMYCEPLTARLHRSEAKLIYSEHAMHCQSRETPFRSHRE